MFINIFYFIKIFNNIVYDTKIMNYVMYNFIKDSQGQDLTDST